MTLRVAFDVDGVFADMEAALRTLTDAPTDQAATPAVEPEAEASSETKSAPEAIPDGESFATDELRPVAPAVRRRAWRIARRTHNFWDTLPELEPGALARLRAVSRAKHWHVVFLTQRPPTVGDSPQLQTQRWLSRHGFDDPSVLIVGGARGQLARALNLDYVIDDVPGYCLDVKLESNARACLIWRNEESLLPLGTRRLGITVFTSVAACLDQMEARRTTRARLPRLIEDLRRHLGLTARSEA